MNVAKMFTQMFSLLRCFLVHSKNNIEIIVQFSCNLIFAEYFKDKKGLIVDLKSSKFSELS